MAAGGSKTKGAPGMGRRCWRSKGQRVAAHHRHLRQSKRAYSHSEGIFNFVKNEDTGRWRRVGKALGMREYDGAGRVIGEHFYK